MQIKTIHLVNYRGIEDLTVKFNSGVNLIIGNNGAGKSSLLGGLSLALESLLWGSAGSDTRKLTRDEVRIITSLIGSVTESVKYCTPVSIYCDFELGGTDYDISYEYDEDPHGDITLATHRQQMKTEVLNKMRELVNDKNSCLPLLSYQSDRREFFTAKNKPEFPAGDIERRQGYKLYTLRTEAVI